MPGEQRRQLPHLVLRRPRQERITVEMDERGLAPALHHAPRRNRRVDSAREQHGDAARRAHRQPARPALATVVIEGVAGNDLDPYHERRVRQIDLPAARLLHATADDALELGRRNRETLVGAADRNAERRHGIGRQMPRSLRRSARHDRAAPAGPARSWPARMCVTAGRAPPASRVRRAARSRRGPSARGSPARRDPRAASRRLRSSRCRNQGRFLPLSAIS